MCPVTSSSRKRRRTTLEGRTHRAVPRKQHRAGQTPGGRQRQGVQQNILPFLTTQPPGHADEKLVTPDPQTTTRLVPRQKGTLEPVGQRVRGHRTALGRQPELLASVAGMRSVLSGQDSSVRLVALASPHCDDDILFSDRGVLRVVARFNGSRVDRANKLSDGRLELAGLIGSGRAASLANLALVEVAQSVCLPAKPRCSECPLAEHCSYGSGLGVQQAMF